MLLIYYYENLTNRQTLFMGGSVRVPFLHHHLRQHEKGRASRPRETPSQGCAMKYILNTNKY